MGVKTITISADNLRLADGSNGLKIVATAPYLVNSVFSNSVTYVANNLEYTPSSDGASYIVTGVVKGASIISIPSHYDGPSGRLPVRAINTSAFYENTDITSVTISSNVRNIGSEAFAGCTNLYELVFKDINPIIYFKNSAKWDNPQILEYVSESPEMPDMTWVGTDSSGCDIYTVSISQSTKYIQFSGRNISTGVPSLTFNNLTCFGCYETYLDSTGSYSVRLCDPDCAAVEAHIADFDLTIGARAFQYCDGLKSTNIPNYVYKLNDTAFMNASALTDVTFSETSGIKSIGRMAFQNCRSLNEITLPDSLEKIGSYAFEACRGLLKVDVGDGLKEIGNNAFYDCEKLTTVSMGADNLLEKIGDYAFCGCDALTALGQPNNKLPNTLWFIGKYAFASCNKITKINFAGTSTAQASGWFYTSGDVSANRTTDGEYNALSADSIKDQPSIATALTNTLQAYTWFKIKQMPAPTISINEGILSITDKTGIADTFMVYVGDDHWATINTSNSSITIIKK